SVDPTNRDTAYVVRSQFGGSQVFKTTNAGQSWTDITFDLPNYPTWKIVLDPRNNNLYVGTDEGVYQLQQQSATAPTHWQHFGTGLPNVQVRDMELNLTTNTLLAGTYGRGVWRTFLDDSRANAGALRAITGSSVWTGPVQLVGDPTNNQVYIAANGTQNLQNGVAPAQLNIVGAISDFTPGSDPRLVKLGQGDVIFSGPHTYGRVTALLERV